MNGIQYNISNYKSLIEFYFDVFLSSSHLPIMDSISMSYSIELRVPFLSRRLFSNAYPDLYNSCQKKKILNNRLRKHYGKDFVNRSKTGFGVFALNLSNSSIDLLIDTLFDRYLSSYYLINKDNLKKKLLDKSFQRFPYVLLALMTYDKIIN